MSQPPPPPPPHGEVPKSSGLPPGKYDIFVIPPHSAGSGFLYLPSLQPNVNSFAAGFACALILVAMFQSMAPAFQAWWNSFQGLGNMGIIMLILGVGFGAWSLGRTQTDGPPGGSGTSSFGGQNTGGGFNSPGSTNTGVPPHSDPPPPPPPHNGPPPPGQEKPKPSWQQPRPQPGTARAETPKGSWEKAREETRKREEERKAKEEADKRREDAARRLRELREKEAREREQREKEAKERREKLEREQREKELLEKLEKERAERERLEREVKEREDKKKEEAARTARKGSSYAFSGVGERINPWPNGKPPAQSSPSTPSKPVPGTASSTPNRKPPAPTARTFVGTDDETYSYRPYDQPKQPKRRKSNSSFVSETSWAPSQSTSRTTPPPSVRGPYTTKDPDKIVIKAVYLFMNQFAKTPASQLVSGVGSVTDGLILRITTEGIFIDDDVRGVPQREWDVKAWTLKLVEVWCPPHCLNFTSSSAPGAKNPNLLHKMASQRVRAADRGATKPLTGDEADAYLTELLRACKDCCRLGLCASTLKDTDIPSPNGQNGEWKTKGLHLLRATIRDQEGKRYLFVLGEEESWKVAVGLQRLRRGTQVRALGVSGMPAAEARNQLEMLGWGG
jgi:hypothetical protein